MKNINILLATALLSMTMVGCSSSYYSSSSYGGDDLYGTIDRTEIAIRQKAEAEARKAEAEARRAEWEARRAEDAYNQEQNSDSFQGVLADDYESAYARRLAGFSSPTYNMPSSYYNFRYGDKFFYVSAYDPAFYNVMIMGDQIWVEPRYVSSMFGSWGSASRFSIGFSWGYNPWYSSWGYNPWYSSWGYNWGYNPWYNPYWGGYNPWWGHNHWWGGHHGGHYPGYHRPSNIVHRRPAYQGGPTYGRGGSSTINRGDRPSTYPNRGTSINRGSNISTGNSGYRSDKNNTYNTGRGDRNNNSSIINSNNGSSTFRNNGSSSSSSSSSSNNNSSYRSSSSSSSISSGSSSFRGGSSSGSSSGGGGGSRNSFGR